ncbi:MAG: fibronectin type III domain-containing protein, partial [Nitrospiraceae bacterium]
MKLLKYLIYNALTLALLFAVTGCGLGSSSDTFSTSNPGLSTGSVTLSWDAPTTNLDGTPLTYLAGYKVYYVRTSANYTKSVAIQNGTFVHISDLDHG